MHLLVSWHGEKTNNHTPTNPVHQRHQVEVRCQPKRHQWDAWNATRTNPVTWMCGGLGAGKTWAMVWWCWMMATEWASDADGLLWEPDFSTYEDTFMVLWRLLIPGEGVLWDQVATKSSGKMLKIHVSKSRTVTIYVRSAMNRQTVMRSEGLTTIGWVGIDEPARMLLGQKAFTNSLGRARAKMSGWSHNPIYMVGSPLGLGHWTAKVMGCTTDHPEMGYHAVYESDPLKHPGYVIRACRTKDNADNLSENYESGARIGMSKALADQEFNASLMHASGMVLPEWSTAVHVLPHDMLREMWDKGVSRALGGADIGRWGAAEVCGRNKDNELLLVGEYYKRDETVIQQGVAMHGLTQDFATRARGEKKVIPWFVDPTAYQTIKLWKTGFEYKGTNYYIAAQKARNDWQPGIDCLRNLLAVRPGLDHPRYPPGNGLGRPGMFVSERNTGFISEAPSYRYLAEEEGKPIKDGMAGADPLCDDHAIDSVRYPVFTTATNLPARSYGKAA